MFLLSTYTNQVKSYCDEVFFKRFMSYDCDKIVVDNTIGIEYTKRLSELTGLDVNHIDVPREPAKTRFLRNVAESANIVREEFLKGDYSYLIIIESDVIPPENLLELFKEAMDMADNWGAIGGLYYSGFHNFKGAGKIELEKTHHVLSGCTIYKREVIEKFPFRWSWDNIGAFPDAWICYDINDQTNLNLYNYKRIVCQHLLDRYGKRGQEKLYSQ